MLQHIFGVFLTYNYFIIFSKESQLRKSHIYPSVRILHRWTVAATLLERIWQKLFLKYNPHTVPQHFLLLKTVMTSTPNLHGIFEALPALTKLRGVEKHRKRAIVTCSLHKNDDSHVQPTRRAVIGLASITLLANAGTRTAVAEDNGFWLNGPLPVPFANNKIDNEETGTRSFLKKGIYIANIGTKGRMQRLRRYAFDLLAMADLIAQEDAWNYVRRYLRLKSTFMYFDFDEVISAASLDDDKKSLTDLANRLFDNFEKLLDAVRKQDVPQIYSRYEETTPLLQEVMIRMA